MRPLPEYSKHRFIAGRDLHCSNSLDTSSREMTRDRQFSPRLAKVSTITESGHSIDLKTAKSTVCFRPIAAVTIAT